MGVVLPQVDDFGGGGFGGHDTILQGVASVRPTIKKRRCDPATLQVVVKGSPGAGGRVIVAEVRGAQPVGTTA